MKLAVDLSVPQLVLSDMGTQLVAGADIIADFLGDPITNAYLRENAAESISFQQHYEGHNELGSLVESCVKLSKRLLSGSVKNIVLSLRDFEYFVCQTVHLVNRRPVAFRESLRDCISDSLPDLITPEMLIHGHSLLSINVIPSLQAVGGAGLDPDSDVDPVALINDTYAKLRKVRNNLFNIYNSEFATRLIIQATNDKTRYRRVKHDPIEVGHIVLLKESYCKPMDYPMAVVKSV